MATPLSFVGSYDRSIYGRYVKQYRAYSYNGKKKLKGEMDDLRVDLRDTLR
jgi:hypothetical protein